MAPTIRIEPTTVSKNGMPASSLIGLPPIVIDVLMNGLVSVPRSLPRSRPEDVRIRPDGEVDDHHAPQMMARMLMIVPSRRA